MLVIAVARHLDGLGLVDYRPDVEGGDAFIATWPSEPDECVVLFPTGGVQQGSAIPYDEPTFQIGTRGQRFDPRPSYERLRSIYGALTGLDGVTLDDGGEDEIRVSGITGLQSDPISLGVDSNQRHRWTLNFHAVTTAPTAHRT